MRLRNIPRADGVIKSHPMVVQDTQKSRGNWKNIFGNDRPVYLEIGMGKGRFLMNMAKEHPLVNFVGIERYSSVLLRALEKYDTEEYKDLQNIRFLCMDATEIENVFNQGEIRKIYLNFSDPWPKARHARRRLTSGTFLDRYAKILPPGGNLEFKTDNTELFRFSLEEIREKEGWRLDKYTYDLHRNDEMNQGNIMTEYEEKFSSLGNPINKLIATRL
ncbi:tRNA (guanine-N(7)-)-methyltransferase [Mediterraneibacter butyricigenes]|jgi:tRNA (guanine-N7-)-methyltransferase|uniref:tRNA (guanine-N(7)-)-methyltransferase n=1 Tax=Mediterraneibacter butyricigenes TaxID=2316025 RepID=A0A391P2A9_9FIRM|nr:tRNA (guanosine(46)-N7)-methyltransferase TrmB [Mediterraneibacter butyricigenes]GCA67250.1 tRNA (guanine-N(7)-)-methyltransferase [Mediterraneibacter butyricigenes]